jgi:ribonucleoside-diphosphate reductase alpha chain
MAIAPTASISIICGGASPGIEPIAANAYTHKTLSGSFPVRNKYLNELLKSKGYEGEALDEIWSEIFTDEGSVQYVDCLTQEEKDVFKTAFELDQRWVIEHAADRTPFVCQAQSLNIFVPGNVHKKVLHDIHWEAWKKGVKTLYYCRSKSIQRAESKQSWKRTQAVDAAAAAAAEENKYDECLACQ